MSQQEIERHYFEMFRNVYPQPSGTVGYGDRPDVIVTGPQKVGIEITNFYVSQGASSSSEQVQSKRRKAVVSEAQGLYLKGGGANIELTFSFNKTRPIKDVSALAEKIAALARHIDTWDNGDVRRDVFKDIPELDFVYLYARVLQYSDEPDPEFPNGQPDPFLDFRGYSEYHNRRDLRAHRAGIYKPLSSAGVWRVGQAHSFGLMSTDRLIDIIRQKEAKARRYATCDAYWLLIVVNFMDSAQEQEIRIDGLALDSDVFQRIIVYKPHFEHIVLVKDSCPNLA
jgi:hypothetical protein